MKKLLMILLLATAACRAPKQASVAQSYSVVERPRVVEIPAVQDSGSIKALFRCDSNNRVILGRYNELWSKYISATSTAIQQPDGSMQLDVKVSTNHEAQKATVTDTYIIKQTPVLVKQPYPVTRPLTKLQSLQIWAGRIALPILALIIVLFVKRVINPLKLLR